MGVKQILLIFAVAIGQSVLATDKKPPSLGKYQLILKSKHITIILVLGILALLGSRVYDSRTDIGPDLKKAAEQSKEKFTKLSDSAQKYTQLFKKLEAANEDENTDAKTLMRLKEQLADAMEDIPEGYWSQLAPINNLTDLQDELAKILQEEGQQMAQKQGAADLGGRVDKGNSAWSVPKQDFNAFAKWIRKTADKIIPGLDKDTLNPTAYSPTASGMKQEAADQENLLKTLSEEDLSKLAESGNSAGALVDELADFPTITGEFIDALKGMEESVSDFEGYMERLKAAAADRVRNKKTMEGVNEFNKGERKTIRPKK